MLFYQYCSSRDKFV